MGHDNRQDVACLIEVHPVNADDPVVAVGLRQRAAVVGDVPVVRAGIA